MGAYHMHGEPAPLQICTGSFTKRVRLIWQSPLQQHVVPALLKFPLDAVPLKLQVETGLGQLHD